MTGLDLIDKLPTDPAAIDIFGMVDRRRARTVAEENALLGECDDLEAAIDRFIRRVPHLLVWFKENHREFPWRRTRDPWAVLLAEILLQRTHADTVAGHYPGIRDKYPDPGAVLAVPREELFEDVKPLGFGNHRVRTLMALAEAIIRDHGGEVPADIQALQEIPRIGPYTARATACFAFGQPVAIIDGNVAVILGRVFEYSSSTRPHKDEDLYAFLDALVPRDGDLARAFNLALLDLRNAVCVDPPCCDSCPLGPGCRFARSDR